MTATSKVTISVVINTMATDIGKRKTKATMPMKMLVRKTVMERTTEIDIAKMKIQAHGVIKVINQAVLKAIKVGETKVMNLQIIIMREKAMKVQQDMVCT